jgi:hypothetical protein
MASTKFHPVDRELTSINTRPTTFSAIVAMTLALTTHRQSPNRRTSRPSSGGFHRQPEGFIIVGAGTASWPPRMDAVRCFTRSGRPHRRVRTHWLMSDTRRGANCGCSRRPRPNSLNGVCRNFTHVIYNLYTHARGRRLKQCDSLVVLTRELGCRRTQSREWFFPLRRLCARIWNRNDRTFH